MFENHRSPHEYRGVDLAKCQNSFVRTRTDAGTVGRVTRVDSSLRLVQLIRREVYEIAGRDSDTHGIEHCDEIDGFLCDRSANGRQMSECRSKHPQYAQHHPSNGGLQSDASHALTDMN